MEIFTNMLVLINLVFVAFGVFVAVETLIFNVNNTENIDNHSNENIDEKTSLKFSNEFKGSRLRSQIVKFEIELRKIGYRNENSNIVKTRNHQYYVKFSHLFHDVNPYSDVAWEKLYVIFSFPMLLFGLLPFILTSVLLYVFEIETLVIYPPFFVILICCFCMPFGLYSDLQTKSAKVIYGLFSLGRVQRVKCTIIEQPDLRFTVFITYCFKFFFTEIELPRKVKTETIKDAVMEYLIARDISYPVKKGHSYTYVESGKSSKAVNEWVETVQFGWLRIIHIISFRITDYKKLLTSCFTRTR